ncbi:MAG: hypothetical protein K1X74_12235 [Pirellulales bacterium]|nr:hypothetical protein [Pirellulales bacterium]
MLGFSYYAALGASEDDIRFDLDDAQRHGFNWLRVWVTWESFGRDVSALDSSGMPRQPYFDRLTWLVAECDRRGLVLDLTLTRGSAAGTLPTLAAHERGVETLVTALKQWRNWYVDLANEHDIRDARHVPVEELKQLRALVRRLDPARLVTASFGGHDLDETDLRNALLVAEVDFLAPHRPRNVDSPTQTEAATQRMLDLLKRIDHVVPVLYQEPFRRGYAAWKAKAEDFVTDLQGSIAGGAAGWCFHNGAQFDTPDNRPRRSFELSEQRLFTQLDAEERQFLERMRAVVCSAQGPVDRNESTRQADNSKVGVLQTDQQAGHYLVWRRRPIMLIGDSVTQGWMEGGENFAGDGYLDALAARGITLVMLWAFKGANGEMQRQDKRIGYDAPELWPWAGDPDNASFDLRHLNPRYFNRLRSFVARAEAKGIVVLVTVHDGWTKTCFGGHPFNRELGNGPLHIGRQYVELADYDREMPEQFDSNWTWQQQNQYFQERFCDRLIGELQSFSNVMYEMFNEGEWYDKSQRRLHELHFLTFFRARCSNLLISNCDHLTGFNGHDEQRLDVISLHPQGWVGQSGKFSTGFRTLPSKPYVCSEPVPEFNGKDPSLDTIRRSAWETALAGAGWVNQNDLSFGWDTQAAASRLATTRDAAYDIAGYCARFFNRSGVRFWRLAPAPQLASTGHCLAWPGHEYVVYAPATQEFTVDLSGAGQESFLARWYDPGSGKFRDGEVVTGGNPKSLFRPPLAGDAVLHLAQQNEDANDDMPRTAE